MSILSQHDTVLMYIEINRSAGNFEQNSFDAIQKETEIENKTLASILSDFQRSELITYERKGSGYYTATPTGKVRAREQFAKIMKIGNEALSHL